MLFAIVVALALVADALAAARPAHAQGGRAHARAAVKKAKATRTVRSVRRAAAGAETVVNGSFETSVAGWSGYNAYVSVTSGGAVGYRSARVSVRAGASDYAISANGSQVGSTSGGVTYSASAYVRSTVPGRTVCLRVREWASGGLAGSAQSCRTATTGWTAFSPIAYTAKADGNELDVYAFQGSALAGDNFLLDGVSLLAGAAPAPAPAPAVAAAAAPAPAPAPLAAVSGLTAGGATATGLTLSWARSSDARVVSYRVARDGAVLATTALPAYGVTGLSCGTSSTYSVVALDATGAASAAATVSAATAACPAPAAPASSRLYADSAPINTPIPDGAALDGNSPAMVAQLVNEASGNGWPISVKQWTSTVYYADASTPRYDVAMTHTPYLGQKLAGVPIPAEARVPGDSDGGMIVVDRSTNCEYDLGAARKNADGTWQMRFGNALSIAGNGVYPSAESPSASGFASLAGKILPEELAAGRIEHAITFGMNATKAGGPVWPAAGSDGWSTAAGAIPEGARLQLDPSLDLNSLGLNSWQKTIARAMQVYGLYLVDTGGTFAISAQNSLSTKVAYPWGDVDYAYMPTSLVSKLRVLRLGAQSPNVSWSFVQNSCARLTR